MTIIEYWESYWLIQYIQGVTFSALFLITFSLTGQCNSSKNSHFISTGMDSTLPQQTEIAIRVSRQTISKDFASVLMECQ